MAAPRRRTRGRYEEVPEAVGRILGELRVHLAPWIGVGAAWRLSATGPACRDAMRLQGSSWFESFFRATGTGIASALTIDASGSADVVKGRRARLDAVAAATAVTSRGTFLSFGGEDSACERLETESFTEVDPSAMTARDAELRTGAVPKSQPLDAASYCAATVRNTDEILFFGGVDAYGSLSNLLRRAKYDGTSWFSRNYKAPSAPSARIGCSLAFHARSGNVFLFGGFTAGSKLFSLTAVDTTLYSLTMGEGASGLNIDSPGDWEVVDGGGTAPTARAYHSCVVVNNLLVFVGGTTTPAGAPCGDVHIYDVVAGNWSAVDVDVVPLPSGVDAAPSLRYLHASVGLDDDCFVIFGGLAKVGGERRELYDFFVGQIDQSATPIALRFFPLHVAILPPPPQFGATLHAVRDGDNVALAVFGGSCYGPSPGIKVPAFPPNAPGALTEDRCLWTASCKIARTPPPPPPSDSD